MQSNNLIESSYPTLLEALRFLAVSFDLKGGNKRIDDKCFEHVDPREVDTFVKELFESRIQNAFGLASSQFISEQINLFKEQYIALIKNHNADGITKEQLVSLLRQYIFPSWIAVFFTNIKEEFGGPSTASLFVEHRSAVSLILDWVSSTSEGWTQLLKSRKKEDQDVIAQWKKGTNLPSMYFLGQMLNWSKESGIEIKNLEQIQFLLLMARGIDYLRSLESGKSLLNSVLLQLWHAPQDLLDEYEHAISELQKTSLEATGRDQFLSIAKLQNMLRPHTHKGINDQFEAKKALDFVRNSFSFGCLTHGIQYWIDWSEAKWNVFSGDLKTANKFYKKAFASAIYQGGISLKDIIVQSMSVAASLEKPDKIFLTHLKWALIQFEYDIPSISDSNSDNTFSGNFETWEIQALKNNFDRFFPESGLFPGTEFDENLSPIMFFLTKQEIKPDFRNPNRKIKVDETGQLKMPQLNWFIIEEDYETFCKLLELGARHNVFSDSQDTPLQLSLGLLDARTEEERSFDDRFFWKLAELPHDKAIINMPSAKRKLLPLILAVHSGQPQVVEKLLKMGANPNQRGLSDEQTALNECLKLIATIKAPEDFKRNQSNHPTTPELLDSYRRHSNGMTGASLEQNAKLHASLQQCPLFIEFVKGSIDKIAVNLLKNLDVESMRHIAALLILNGADVNAEHQSPLLGYTPLMLAAENNEHQIFQLMLEKGGDPKKSYLWNGTKVDCWKIAEFFGSTEVVDILQRKQFH